MFCPKCGATNTEGVRFCKDCGAPIASAPQTTPVTPINPVSAYAPSPLVQKKKKDFDPKLLLAFAALLFAVPYFFSIITSFIKGAATNESMSALESCQTWLGYYGYSGFVNILSILCGFGAAGLSGAFAVMSLMKKQNTVLAFVAIAFSVLCLSTAIINITEAVINFKYAGEYAESVAKYSSRSSSSSYSGYSDYSDYYSDLF